MEAVRSNLEFRSNLQPVYDDKWSEVHKKVMDPFALEIMQKHHLFLSEKQRNQIQYASEHCAYAYKDDYPWGTIRLADGREVPVCKCLRVTCHHFSRCRPDFQKEELDILEENKNHSFRVLEFSTKRDEEQAVVEKEQETIPEPDLTQEPKVRVQPVVSVTSGPENVEPTIAEPVHDVPEKVAEPKKPEIVSVVPQLKPEDTQIKPSITPGETPVEHKEPSEDQQPGEVGFSSFTAVDQNALIEAPVQARAVINAGPGTGKTWTIIEKIIRLINSQEVDPENIMILCFSRAAVEVVEQRLQQAADAGRLGYEYHSILIRTFDSFATYVIAWVLENCPELLPGYSFEGQDYDARIMTANSIMKKKKDLVEKFEHLIVDEVQDLVGCRAEMVLELLRILPDNCGFTLLGDACQALYDWQANDNPAVLSSEGFYSELFRDWPKAKYWTFKENHRQEGSLAHLAVPYRDAILTGDPASRNKIVAKILDQISDSGINIHRVTAESIAPFLQGGTLGILTRTNGQALKISELLRNADIDHVVQRSADQTDLNPWIADVFCEYPNETVNEAMFAPFFTQAAGVADMEKERNAWNALISTQYGDGQSRYSVEKLLEGILRNGKAKELFVSNEVDAKVTVSNIHRAKGREFDSVLVLGEVLTPQDSEKDDLQEHKVRYVAITRPKHKLADLKMGKQFIYVDRATRRCFQANFSKFRKNQRYLSHIEVGLTGDVDIRSFAEERQIQDYIKNELKPGTRVKLIKCPESATPWVQYKIVLEENENVIIGRTGKGFSIGLRNAIEKLNWPGYTVTRSAYPNILGDVYVGSKVSCISTFGVGLDGAKAYGHLAVWRGYTLAGLAKYERDLY